MPRTRVLGICGQLTMSEFDSGRVTGLREAWLSFRETPYSTNENPISRVV